jgi:opacity protein-like surface antigen
MHAKALAAASLALAASAATAADVGVAGAFSQGRMHFGVTAGSGSAFDESYFVLGVGVSYYVVDGLGVGIHYEWWSGGDPDITKLTGSVQYVFHQVQPVKPYLGGFYRRTDVDRLPDLDSVGARAGVYIGAGRNAYIGLGVVYESYLDCEESIYRSCDSTYAEVTFTIAF